MLYYDLSSFAKNVGGGMGAIKATNSETVVGLDLMLVLSRLSAAA